MNRTFAETQSTLKAALTETFGVEPMQFAPVHGGMICDAFRVEFSGGASIFLKTSRQAPQRLFDTEANSLRALRHACNALPAPHNKTLRVPEVIAVSEEPAFLALEWISGSTPRDVKVASRSFGAALAALHRESTSNNFGWNEDNFLGRLPQINKSHNNWPDFYRECRLMPQIERAKNSSLLSPANESLLMKVIELLPNLLRDLESRPALLHGDLWGGNYFFVGESTLLYDPACYYGEREMDVAYTELFGGFSPQFHDGYNQEYPLQAGYEKRKPLHQLYHLINHLIHFGQEYSSAVESACRHILSN